MRVIYTSKRNVEKVWDARYTLGARYKLGARYLSKNTVHGHVSISKCRTKSQYKEDNSYFERVEEFRFLEKNLTNQNSIKEEIRADWRQEMFAIIRCRIFCPPICYPII
jgi:hypothetical protein